MSVTFYVTVTLSVIGGSDNDIFLDIFALSCECTNHRAGSRLKIHLAKTSQYLLIYLLITLSCIVHMSTNSSFLPKYIWQRLFSSCISLSVDQVECRSQTYPSARAQVLVGLMDSCHHQFQMEFIWEAMSGIYKLQLYS